MYMYMYTALVSLPCGTVIPTSFNILMRMFLLYYSNNMRNPSLHVCTSLSHTLLLTILHTYICVKCVLICIFIVGMLALLDKNLPCTLRSGRSGLGIGSQSFEVAFIYIIHVLSVHKKSERAYIATVEGTRQGGGGRLTQPGQINQAGFKEKRYSNGGVWSTGLYGLPGPQARRM